MVGCCKAGSWPKYAKGTVGDLDDEDGAAEKEDEGELDGRLELLLQELEHLSMGWPSVVSRPAWLAHDWVTGA